MIDNINTPASVMLHSLMARAQHAFVSCPSTHAP